MKCTYNSAKLGILSKSKDVNQYLEAVTVMN